MRRRFSRQTLYCALGVVAIGLIVAFTLLIYVNLQGPWIDAVPGVRLEPVRPILLEKDVKPDSAFDLLRRVAIAMKSADASKVKAEQRKLDLVPWSDEEFPAGAQALDDSAEAIELARRAVNAVDPQVLTMTSFDQPLEYLSPLMDIARLLKNSAGLRTRAAPGQARGRPRVPNKSTRCRCSRRSR